MIKDLFDKPMILRRPQLQMQFRLRLARRSALGHIGEYRADDLFLINVESDAWEHNDINVHKFEVERLADLEYILHLRNDHG